MMIDCIQNSITYYTVELYSFSWCEVKLSNTQTQPTLKNTSFPYDNIQFLIWLKVCLWWSQIWNFKKFELHQPRTLQAVFRAYWIKTQNVSWEKPFYISLLVVSAWQIYLMQAWSVKEVFSFSLFSAWLTATHTHTPPSSTYKTGCFHALPHAGAVEPSS